VLTDAFEQRTRQRVVEIREALAKFRELAKDTVRQISKISKQHVTERTRLYDTLGALADDVLTKLPGDVPDDEYDRASKLQDQINDLAGDVEEISLLENAIEDLVAIAKETVDEAYASLREAETQLAKVTRQAAKIGI
jgi:gas vesicle protein